MIVMCSECGSDVSSSADFCPNCGAQPSYFIKKPKQKISTPTQKKKSKLQNDVNNLFSSLGCFIALIIFAFVIKYIAELFGWNF